MFGQQHPSHHRVTFGGAHGEAQHFPYLFKRQPANVVQLDDLCLQGLIFLNRPSVSSSANFSGADTKFSFHSVMCTPPPPSRCERKATIRENWRAYGESGSDAPA